MHMVIGNLLDACSTDMGSAGMKTLDCPSPALMNSSRLISCDAEAMTATAAHDMYLTYFVRLCGAPVWSGTAGVADKDSHKGPKAAGVVRANVWFEDEAVNMQNRLVIQLC